MTGDLPPPNQRNVDLLAQYFYHKGLTLDDMVILSGTTSSPLYILQHMRHDAPMPRTTIANKSIC